MSQTEAKLADALKCALEDLRVFALAGGFEDGRLTTVFGADADASALSLIGDGLAGGKRWMVPNLRLFPALDGTKVRGAYLPPFEADKEECEEEEAGRAADGLGAERDDAILGEPSNAEDSPDATQRPGTIFIAPSFFAGASMDALVDVLLEGIGQAIDWQVKAAVAPSDKGALFAKLIQFEIIALPTPLPKDLLRDQGIGRAAGSGL